MDVEKTIEFILDQQARFVARFGAGMDELRLSQQETDCRLRSLECLTERLARIGAARLREHEHGLSLHEERMQEMERHQANRSEVVSGAGEATWDS